MARTERGHYANLKTDEVGRSVIASGVETTDGQRTFGQGTAGGLAGTAVGSALATGAIILHLALSGVAAGQGTATGSIHENPLALTGTSSGVATASGNLLVQTSTSLQGTAVGVGTASGALHESLALTGIASGVGTASGQIVLHHDLGGTASGHATSSGDLTITVVPALAGTAVGRSYAAGRLGYIRILAGTATGVGSAAGNLTYLHAQPLTGTASGVGHATGALGEIEPPANDPFSNPFALVGDTGTIGIQTISDSYEASEPDPQIGLGSVWYVYTPTFDGTLHVGTGQTPAPAWQTRVDVYSGDTLGALTPEGLGDLGSDPQPSVVDSLTGGTDLMVTGGVTYRIRVQDTSSNRADGVLNWSWATVAPVTVDPTVTLVSSGVSVFSVQINASNLTPGEVLTFNLYDNDTATNLGPLLDTATADASGVLAAASVSIIPTSGIAPVAGNYSLIVHATSDITLPFSLTLLESDVPQPLPTAPLPVPTQPVQRWVFQDVTPLAPIPSWTVPINPNDMTSPFGDKNITEEGTVSAEGQTLIFEGMQGPVDWSFTGWVIDQTHHDNLVYWYERPYRTYIVDHFKRAWEVYIYGLDIKPVRAIDKPWKHQYTMKAKITRGPIYLGTQIESFDTAASTTVVDPVNYVEGTGSGIAYVGALGTDALADITARDFSAYTSAMVDVSLVNSDPTLGVFTVYLQLSVRDTGGHVGAANEVGVILRAGSITWQEVLFDLTTLPGTVDRTAINHWAIHLRTVPTHDTVLVNLDDLKVR